MSRIAILHPTTLLGREVRELLEDRPQLWTELTLLSTDQDEIGRLTDVGGGAGVIVEGRPEDVANVDLLFVCGDAAGARPFVDALPAGGTAVVVSADGESGPGRPVVAGLTDDEPTKGEVLRSPHPGTIFLAHLLAPLRDLGLVGATATLIQPTSLYDEAGLDDLFEQTRGILAMKGGHSEMFGRQLAFNVIPARVSGGRISAEVSEVLELPAPVSVQLLQGGVFHGMSASLHLEVSGSGGAGGALGVRDALADSPYVEITDEPDLLGPIDAAAEERLLVGHVTQDRPGSVWIWAVMDNLTRGGALNAVEIAERLS